MAKLKRAVVSALAFLLVMSNSAVAGDADDGYLSAVEQEVLNELNLARTNPKRYAEFLSEMRPYFNGNHLERPGELILVTREGVAAVDEAIGFLRSTAPLSDLRASRGLSRAAKTHVKDQQNGAMGHTGSDGSQPWDRMSRYGTWQDKVAENISYGGNSTRGVVIQLIVDDGVPGRGHRVNMFDPQYRFVGVACGTHARLRDMCVMDFAARYSERSKR
ncbi:MAG: CAP domain-containing protein [Thiogranum sp.]